MDGLEFILTEALDLCKKGKCKYITPEELIILTEIVHKPETMGREDAAKYLGLSLNKFHELRSSGVIPEPRKRKGFKEKEYYTSDLRKYLEANKL